MFWRQSPPGTGRYWSVPVGTGLHKRRYQSGPPKLQSIEWRFWCRDPKCAEMGKFTVGTGRQAPVWVGFVRFRSDVR